MHMQISRPTSPGSEGGRTTSFFGLRPGFGLAGMTHSLEANMDVRVSVKRTEAEVLLTSSPESRRGGCSGSAQRDTHGLRGDRLDDVRDERKMWEGEVRVGGGNKSQSEKELVRDCGLSD